MKSNCRFSSFRFLLMGAFTIFQSMVAFAQSPFITIWQTDNPGVTNNNQIQIPGTGTNYSIAWEEVGNPTNTGSTIGNNTTTVTMSSPGTYSVSITPGGGSFTRISFNDVGDKKKILSVNQWGNIQWTSMSQAFHGCQNLDCDASDLPDLSLVSTCSHMFRYCYALDGPMNIGNWDISTVTDLSYMFFDAISFNQDIGNWDVSSVTNMFSMMLGANAFNQNISGWDVSSVTNMGQMFNSTFVFNSDIGGWDVSSVTNMYGMFWGASGFNQDIGGWDVSSVTNMENMFNSAVIFNQDIGGWDLSSVTNISYMLTNPCGIDCEHYSDILIGWNNNPLTPNNLSLGAHGRQYGTNAVPARNNLINSKGWGITGDSPSGMDCSGCIGNVSVTIDGPTEICNGASAELDAGFGFSAYLWNTGATTQTIIISSPNTYSVTVTDADGCTGSDEHVVTQAAAPMATAGSNSPVCQGATINLTSSGGISYSWSGPNGFSSNSQNPSIPNAMNIHEGTYSVTVTGGNGCTGTSSTSVVVNAVPIGTASSNSPICSGSTLNLLANGGNNYMWGGPNGFNSNQQNPSIPNAMPIHSGTYSVTVTNADGCIHSTTTNAVVNAIPSALASSNSPLCTGETLLLMASGGATYQWTGPGGFNSSEQNPFIQNVGPPQSGTYSVTVTSNQGCASTALTGVDIFDNPIPKITGSTSFCVGGFSILSAGYGYSEYHWSNGATTEEIYVDQAGQYSVTVSDANGCTGTDEVEVKVGTSLSPEITGDTLLCDGEFGILNAGNGFTTYLWSDGSTTKEITVNSAGPYSVTVSDATGCTGEDEVEVVTASIPMAVASSNSPVCEGQDIQLSASGGTTYHWTGPLGFQSNLQNPTIQNAMSGMDGAYRVIVSNGGACKDTAWVLVELGGGSASLHAEALEPNCPGDTLFLYATGGNTYLWTGPDSFSSTLQNPFIPFAGPENSGIYIVADTSVQGCVLNDTIKVFIPVGPIPEITGNLYICNGEEATLDAGPGFQGYYWSNGKRGRVMHTTIPGFYWVLVTDGSCCIGVDSAEVVITNKLNPEIKGDTAACVGEFSILDAGQGYDLYLWSTGDTLQKILVSVAGEYSVTVTNSAGCVGADTVQFKVYGFPQVAFQADAVSCVDSCDGQLEILPTEAGYTYLWSTGDTTKVVDDLCSGVYLVTVTSPGGCSTVQGSYVPPALQLNVTINEVANTLIALPSGGAPPYTYLWNSGQTSQSIPSSAGLHSVTVTDANGCEQSGSILITSINDVPERGKGIMLLPNPADGNLILKPLPGPIFESDLDYEVYNSAGVKVTDGEVLKGESPVSFNTYHWSPGSYILKVMYPGGGSEVIPFVVVH